MFSTIGDKRGFDDDDVVDDDDICNDDLICNLLLLIQLLLLKLLLSNDDTTTKTIVNVNAITNDMIMVAIVIAL